MEWDLINYFCEKLYIEHKNQRLTLSTDFTKEKVSSSSLHQTLKTTTDEIESAKSFWSNPNWAQPSPPHSIQWSVISPRHFLPRPLLSSRNGAKTIFLNQFPGTVKYENAKRLENLSLLKREDGDSQPSWLWFLFILGSVWIVMNSDYLEDGFDLLILITSNWCNPHRCHPFYI